MKVIALKLGYYGGRLIEPNTVFDVPAGLTSRWFVPVAEPPNEPDNPIDTVAEIKARLDELGVDYPRHAKKAELEAIWKAAEDEAK